jgi:predicted adenylyl cyclase CyaB
MARNIELKARCPNPDAAHAIARTLGPAPPSIERQHDTYFTSARGRLKLRQRWLADCAGRAQLIWYERADAAQARASDYTLVELPDHQRLRQLLASALGVAVEVRKERAVYLHDNVRIHLDLVSGLGSFIELEAIVDAACSDAEAHAKVDRLRAVFGITADRIVTRSYADLLRR